MTNPESAPEDETIKLQEFASSYIRVKSNFKDDETKSYLLFQPICKYVKKIGNSDLILEWKSKELSDESIKPPVTSGNILATSWDYISVRKRVKLVGQCSMVNSHLY